MTAPVPLPAAHAARPRPAFIQEQDFAARQYRGRRETQEDYYAFADASEPGRPPLDQVLLVVGDGLGGHAGGSVASYLVVNSFVRAFHEQPGSQDWRLRIALDTANETLGIVSQRLPPMGSSMGTTLLAVLVSRQQVHWISVGDSILLLYRQGKLQRLNEDHSLAPILAERVRAGSLSAAEAAAHPDRHALQSAVLGQQIQLVDFPPEPLLLEPGDILIAASDGILTLTEKALEELLSFGKNTTADKIADAILFAIRRINFERQDNTTVGVVKIH